MRQHSRLRFVWSENRIQIGLVACLLLVAMASTIPCLFPAWKKNWADFVDPWITVSTLLVAIFVWYNNQMIAREAAFPRLLNVFFLHEGKLKFACIHAYLSHEGDIRTWAQQIGKQMTGEYLKFGPYFRRLPAQQITIKGQIHIVHGIGFDLDESPKNQQDPSTSPLKCIIWLPTPDSPSPKEIVSTQSIPQIELANTWSLEEWNNVS